MKTKKRRGKFRSFFTAFLITIICICFIFALAQADMVARNISGYSENSAFVFSTNKSGMQFSFFDKQFSLCAPQFINGFLKGCTSFFAKIKDIILLIRNFFSLFI